MSVSLPERIDRCAELSWTSQPVEARLLARELAREALLSNDQRQAARALHVLAWSSQLNGETMPSFEAASLARRIWLSLGETAEAARSGSIASQNLTYLGLTDDALALALASVAEAERAGDAEISFLARNAQATAMVHGQEHRAALALLHELAVAAPSPRHAAIALNNIAYIHVDLAQSEAAGLHLAAAVEAGLAGIEAAQAAGFVWAQRCVLNVTSEALALLGRFDEAEVLVNAAEALPGEAGIFMEISTATSRAEIAYRRHDLEQAAVLFEHILRTAVSIRDIDSAVQSSGRLAEIHAAMGDYREAYHAHQAYHRHQMMMAGEEARRRARVVEIGLETDRLRAEAKQLADDAMRDPLTGLANRRKVDQMRERMEGSAFAVVLFDIDHFKRVNDRFSHSIGDRVLGEIAQLAEAALGDGQLAARIGGEEFVLLLPLMGIDDAAKLAERLRLAIAGHHGASIAPDLAVTASFGVAASTGGDSTGEALAMADRRLLCGQGCRAQWRHRVRRRDHDASDGVISMITSPAFVSVST